MPTPRLSAVSARGSGGPHDAPQPPRARPSHRSSATCIATSALSWVPRSVPNRPSPTSTARQLPPCRWTTATLEPLSSQAVAVVPCCVHLSGIHERSFVSLCCGQGETRHRPHPEAEVSEPDAVVMISEELERFAWRFGVLCSTVMH